MQSVLAGNTPTQYTIPKDKREILVQHIHQNNNNVYSEVMSDIKSIVNNTIAGLLAFTSSTEYAQAVYNGVDSNGNYLFTITAYGGKGRIGWR